MSKKNKTFLILIVALVAVAIVVLCVSLLEKGGTASERKRPTLQAGEERIVEPQDEPQRVFPPEDVR